MSTWADTSMLDTPVLIPERDMRGAGCDDRCQVITAFVPGRFGRSDLLLHSAAAHEAYGRAHGEDGRASGSSPVVVSGRLQIDLDGLVASVDDRAVGLSPTELRLLVLLARQIGQVVAYTELLAAVWGPEFSWAPRSSWMHMIRATVSRLRRRLIPDGDLIVAVWGVGLRLEAVPPGEAPVRPLVYPPTLGAAWARDWSCCQRCGQTRLPHNGRGLCMGCWKSTGRPHV